MSHYFQAYTQVLDGLPLSTTSAGELARHVCRYFQAYTQVQVYLSWPGQPVATAPHQDAHAVFVVQVHGAKRWCVYRSPAPLTLKQLQRGKHGDRVEISDRRTLGELLLNVTLRPGQVLIDRQIDAPHALFIFVSIYHLYDIHLSI